MNINLFDSPNIAKHKLLGILYKKGKVKSGDKLSFDFNDISLSELSLHMNPEKIQAITRVLINTKEVEMTTVKCKITAYGVESYLYGKYQNESIKSLIDYTKNVLQIILFISTIVLIVIDRVLYKPKVDKLIEDVTKMQGENEVLKNFLYTYKYKIEHKENSNDTTSHIKPKINPIKKD